MNYLRLRFLQQRGNATMRSLKFNLTYEEWLSIWTESGKLHLRGRRADQYVMARHNDTGAYEVGNVSIITNTQNHKQRVHKKKENT